MVSSFLVPLYVINSEPKSSSGSDESRAGDWWYFRSDVSVIFAEVNGSDETGGGSEEMEGALSGTGL